MLVDTKTLQNINYQGKIMLSLRPDFLEATNIKPKDQIIIVYEDDQIVIKKQGREDNLTIDIAGYMEKMKDYQQFYRDLEKDVVEFVGKGDRKGSLKIDNLLNEARQKMPGVEIDKKIFLKEMTIYLREKGIRMIRSADMESLIFKVIEVENKKTKENM